ncbi:MAG: acyltransferase [Bacteroidia bacterium]
MISSGQFRSSSYFPQINLLRGIAAVMVSIFHYIYFTGKEGNLFYEQGMTHAIGTYGCQGVYIFFVISGFVIPLSMHKGNYRIPLIGKFLLKRSIRIEPPYLASMVVILLISSYFAHIWNLPYPFDLTKVLLHIGYLIPFTGGKYEWYNILYWTLAVEFQYYLAMAFLYPLLSHKNRIWRYLVLLLFLFAPLLYTNPAFLPLFAPCFLLGFILFLFYTGKMETPEMLIWLFAVGTMNYFYRDPSVIISTSIAFFFIWKIRTDTWVGNRLGDISYSYYLMHGIIGSNFLFFYSSVYDSYPVKIALVLSAILISIMLSTLFWWLIERPSKNWSHRIKLH